MAGFVLVSDFVIIIIHSFFLYPIPLPDRLKVNYNPTKIRQLFL